MSLLRDFVCVRLIQSGKHAQAIKIDHEFAASTLNESKSEAEPRRKMVRELYEALSIPERTLLDAEIEGLTRGKPVPNGIPKPQPQLGSNSSIKDISMSESWEEIPRPPPSGQLNGKTSTRDALAPVSGSNSFYELSSSANGAPSILPISSGTQTASCPRPSFTLSSSLSSSISRKPQFPTITISNSSGSGNRLPPSVSQPLSNSNSFSPASRRANAFYKPPHVAPQGVKRSFESSLGHDIDMDDEEKETRLVTETHEEEVPAQNERMQQQDSDEAVWEQRELEFSVFGNTKKPTKRATTPASPEAASVVQNGRSVLPGTFSTDEEHEHEAEAREPTPPPTTRARASGRRTQSRKTMRTPQAPEPKRARRSEQSKPRLKQSVPGALLNSDEEEDEDDEDQIGPLPSPPRRGTARKARDTTPASDVGDEEAGQTRRRSSRLSSTGGDSIKKAGLGSATAGKTKKNARATAKKKR